MHHLVLHLPMLKIYIIAIKDKGEKLGIETMAIVFIVLARCFKGGI
jgi:hypothetical protein